MSQIFSLALKYEGQQGKQIIYPSLVKCGQDLILIDCGYPGFLTKIENAVQETGFSMSEITAIVITHHDLDHVGSLSRIRCRYPWIKVYSSAIEAAFIEGRERAPRLVQAEALFETLDEQQKVYALEFQKTLESIEAAKVDGFLSEGESPWPDLLIIETPGHTPGHLSLFHHPSNTVIAGDAVVIGDGEPDIANPEYTLDLPAAISSVEKLAKIGAERILCFHGGELNEGAGDKLRNLLRRYGQLN
ncbi:MBL fold metallo-hydrolase [Desertivirga brevis]|uniref:MBL fold metallo-hydrolase n=1 Tax=Desertivirga brevis TaxID=2810310 RepID=UPI001A96A222